MSAAMASYVAAAQHAMGRTTACPTVGGNHAYSPGEMTYSIPEIRNDKVWVGIGAAQTSQAQKLITGMAFLGGCITGCTNVEGRQVSAFYPYDPNVGGARKKWEDTVARLNSAVGTSASYDGEASPVWLDKVPTQCGALLMSNFYGASGTVALMNLRVAMSAAWLSGYTRILLTVSTAENPREWREIFAKGRGFKEIDKFINKRTGHQIIVYACNSLPVKGRTINWKVPSGTVWYA